MVVFGAQVQPCIPLSPHTRLEMIIEDHRSEEEKEAALRRKMERNTYALPGFEEYGVERYRPKGTAIN